MSVLAIVLAALAGATMITAAAAEVRRYRARRRDYLAGADLNRPRLGITDDGDWIGIGREATTGDTQPRTIFYPMAEPGDDDDTTSGPGWPE